MLRHLKKEQMMIYKTIFGLSVTTLVLTSTAHSVVAKSAHKMHRLKFDVIDANADGYITKAEITSHQNTKFENHDVDNSGFVSKDELKAAYTQRATERQSRTGKPYDVAKIERRVERIFGRLDTDNNGKVTQTEMIRRQDQFFERADADKDGRISKAEAKAVRQERRKNKNN